MVLCSCKSLDGWIEPSYDPWLDSINEQTIIPTSPKLGSPMYQCPHLTGDTATTTREGNHTNLLFLLSKHNSEQSSACTVFTVSIASQNCRVQNTVRVHDLHELCLKLQHNVVVVRFPIPLASQSQAGTLSTVLQGDCILRANAKSYLAVQWEEVPGMIT